MSSTLVSSGGTQTASILFRNVNELGCLQVQPPPTCSGLTMNNALTHTSTIEVTDSDVQSSAALQGAFAGGRKGFDNLVT